MTGHEAKASEAADHHGYVAGSSEVSGAKRGTTLTKCLRNPVQLRCWGRNNRAEPQFGSNFEEILLSRSRKASKISESSAWRAAMPASDLGGGGRVFRAFEGDAHAIANRADDFETARLIS
jgi:hypothetical protein